MSDKTRPVTLLKRNDKFTYIGAFAEYWVLKEPVPDPTYEGRVLIEARRVSKWRDVDLTIRLPHDAPVELLLNCVIP